MDRPSGKLLDAPHVRLWGRLRESDGARLRIAGLARFARVGDRLQLRDRNNGGSFAEVIAVSEHETVAMLMDPPTGLAAGCLVERLPFREPSPCDEWLGHALDAFGCLADGTPAPAGASSANLWRRPPAAARRRGIGPPLSTGLAALDTLLPICRGQRLGVFAGSGVGKSKLLRDLAHGVDADVAVIGLIGERGREVSELSREILSGPNGKNCLVIAASSDQPATIKRRASQLTLAAAEHFRDQGKHVLCLLDSVTRFAEAHREVALAAGEPPALRAFPPSTAPSIAALCERAGPGEYGDLGGDITAIFTVLVQGSDMEEPVADMVRGILDGHIVLDRAIAERGRFPAIDLRRSVSRSAPSAWTSEEAKLSAHARALIARYEEQAPMIQVGLYSPGLDPALDEAVARYPALDEFLAARAPDQHRSSSFAKLASVLDVSNS